MITYKDVDEFYAYFSGQSLEEAGIEEGSRQYLGIILEMESARLGRGDYTEYYSN